MSKGFVKLSRSSETEWLLRKPFAFALLSLVALRAQRISNHPSGLKSGEALIGDHKSIGATRGQYRGALAFLVENKLIEIIETCRSRKNANQSLTKTHQKSTTKLTTVGTKVKILGSMVCDINVEVNNHRENHRLTTDEPPPNHEQEVKKERSKKNNSKPAAPVADAPAVAFSALEELGLTAASIRSIKSSFSKERMDQYRLDHAVLWSKTAIIKTTLGRAILWAARNLPEIPEVIDAEINRILAVKCSREYDSEVCVIDILSKAVEFISKNGQICYGIIPFESSGFKNNFEKHLIEKKFKQKTEKYA